MQVVCGSKETYKYAASDKKCIQWITKLMKETNAVEMRDLFQRIILFLNECPKEEIDPIRGKYLAFVKDESNQYQLFEYILNNGLESTEYGLTNAFLFFIPTEEAYCGTATMPCRNEIEPPRRKAYCRIS
jgi:hypothetical protein